MNIEGLWLARTTQVDSAAPPMAPNIIVLETGRLFGGDSAYFQIGSYEVEGGRFHGRLRSRTHTLVPGAENVFGMTGPVDYEMDFSGELVGEHLVGKMMPVGVSIVLDFEMTKLADLPG